MDDLPESNPPMLRMTSGEQRSLDGNFVNTLWEEFCEKVFKLVDVDGNGFITKAELIAAAKNKKKSPELNTLKRLLKLPDDVKEKDGTMHDLSSIFHTIDKDDSGAISLDELKDFILHRSTAPAPKLGDNYLVPILSIAVIGCALAFVMLRNK